MAEADLNVRIEALRRELEMKHIELAALTLEETRRVDQVGNYRSAQRRSRSADLDVTPAHAAPRGRR
jgi:hypothetical protein